MSLTNRNLLTNSRCLWSRYVDLDFSRQVCVSLASTICAWVPFRWTTILEMKQLQGKIYNYLPSLMIILQRCVHLTRRMVPPCRTAGSGWSHLLYTASRWVVSPISLQFLKENCLITNHFPVGPDQPPFQPDPKVILKPATSRFHINSWSALFFWYLSVTWLVAGHFLGLHLF